MRHPGHYRSWSAAAWERVDAWTWTQHARYRMSRWSPAPLRRCRQVAR